MKMTRRPSRTRATSCGTDSELNVNRGCAAAERECGPRHHENAAAIEIAITAAAIVVRRFMKDILAVKKATDTRTHESAPCRP
jgi:hypothetical protein